MSSLAHMRKVGLTCLCHDLNETLGVRPHAARCLHDKGQQLVVMESNELGVVSSLIAFHLSRTPQDGVATPHFPRGEGVNDRHISRDVPAREGEQQVRPVPVVGVEPRRLHTGWESHQQGAAVQGTVDIVMADVDLTAVQRRAR